MKKPNTFVPTTVSWKEVYKEVFGEDPDKTAKLKKKTVKKKKKLPEGCIHMVPVNLCAICNSPGINEPLSEKEALDMLDAILGSGTKKLAIVSKSLKKKTVKKKKPAPPPEPPKPEEPKPDRWEALAEDLENKEE